MGVHPIAPYTLQGDLDPMPELGRAFIVKGAPSSAWDGGWAGQGWARRGTTLQIRIWLSRKGGTLDREPRRTSASSSRRRDMVGEMLGEERPHRWLWEEGQSRGVGDTWTGGF